jgi:thioredoxin reductase/NAD-dependent dihydropyrimidine dehydrogenase PreA subunit
MITTAALIPVYALPLALAGAGWGWHHARRTRTNRALLAAARASGLTAPPGLHPVIDPARCIGCGACVRACPEADVLGLIGRTATLVQPWACVGHGTCSDACPTGAIALVFGSAAHPIAVPSLGVGGETSLPGIHVAGELGGLGLIRNAITQGSAVIDHIAKGLRAAPAPPGPDRHDVVIVGCGPAGMAAALGARAHGLDCVVVDQASLGGSIAHYPRGKLVMTGSAHLPLIGEVALGTVDKEALLAFWQDVLARGDLHPRFEERVETVVRDGHDWVVVTDRARLRTRCVLLATGRGGSPRRIGVPGEDLAKVTYRLGDPAQYAGQRVMVVGGGDSALEAAAALADTPGTTVTLVHRGADFARAGPVNRAAIDRLEQAGALHVQLGTRPVAIDQDAVEVTGPDGLHTIANDAVIICAGGTLPDAWLARIGIAVEWRDGSAPLPMATGQPSDRAGWPLHRPEIHATPAG